MEKYFYYINYPNKYLKIHKGSCRFCNDGSGIQKNILEDKNGNWSEKFSTYTEVFDKANDLIQNMLRNISIKKCKICKPSSNNK